MAQLLPFGNCANATGVAACLPAPAFHPFEVLFAACELGVFDLLAKAPVPLGSAEVAARLGTSCRATQLLLDACVSLKLLQVETRGGEGKLRGRFEGGIFSTHILSTLFSVKGQKGSISRVVGSVLSAAASRLCLWSPHASQTQAWLVPNKTSVTKTGRGPDTVGLSVPTPELSTCRCGTTGVCREQGKNVKKHHHRVVFHHARCIQALPFLMRLYSYFGVALAFFP